LGVVEDSNFKLTHLLQLLPLLRVELLHPLLELHYDEISRLPSFEVAFESIGEALEPGFREYIECQLDVAVGE